MTRYLKALGAATMVVLAIWAVGAGGAAAQQGVLTSDGPVTPAGTEFDENTNALTVFGAEMQCPESHYAGHKIDETPHEFIESGATEVTITPTYGTCNGGSTGHREVHMNSCDYEFYDFTAAEGQSIYGLTVAVECEKEADKIEITGGTCIVRIPEQTEMTGLHATNEPGGKIRVHGTLQGITAHTCTGIETNEAQWHTDLRFEGLSKDEEVTEVEFSKAGSGVLTSDGPVTLEGTEFENTNALTAFGAEMQCPESHYAGHKIDETPHEFVESGATEVTITPEYTNCENGNEIAHTVHMNSCDWEFYDFKAAGEGIYGLTTHIDCEETGNEITITGDTCIVRIPEQTELTGLHATNEEGGKIRVHGTLHGITAHTCLGLETNQARWHTDLTFEGLNEEGGTTQVEISH